MSKELFSKTIPSQKKELFSKAISFQKKSSSDYKACQENQPEKLAQQPEPPKWLKEKRKQQETEQIQKAIIQLSWMFFIVIVLSFFLALY